MKKNLSTCFCTYTRSHKNTISNQRLGTEWKPKPVAGLIPTSCSTFKPIWQNSDHLGRKANIRLKFWVHQPGKFPIKKLFYKINKSRVPTVIIKKNLVNGCKDVRIKNPYLLTPSYHLVVLKKKKKKIKAVII